VTVEVLVLQDRERGEGHRVEKAEQPAPRDWSDEESASLIARARRGLPRPPFPGQEARSRGGRLVATLTHPTTILRGEIVFLAYHVRVKLRSI
jgi:hypothetical protein